MKTQRTSNRMNPELRSRNVERLQRRLSDLLDLAASAKQAHWNVRGSNFLSLHQFFDRMHAELHTHADTVAERLTALGGLAYGTTQETERRSSLAPYPIDATESRTHVQQLAERCSHLGEALVADVDASASLGDAATSDVFTEVSRGIDQMMWFLDAHEPDTNG